MDRPSLIRELGILGDWFGITVSATRMKGYAEWLLELPDPDVQQAFTRAKRECKFFPSFAELLEFAGHKPLTPAEEAEREWLALRNFKGPLKNMDLSGPGLVVVKAMGGRGGYPGSFGQWSADQEAFKKKEFTSRYIALFNPPRPKVPGVPDKEAASVLNKIGVSV